MQWAQRQRGPFFHITIIVGVGLLLTVPALLYGFPAGAHDSRAHLAWYTEFSEQLWDGELYPRWLIGENAGLGNPIFFYYGPVPYYLTSLLRPFFAGDRYGWYQLGLSASLALIISGLAAYLWIKSITDERAAIVAAILYMIAPYHVAIDLYERGAFAEYWAFVWIPLIFYFTQRIMNGQRLAIPGLAVSYALLIMTHLPTTLLTSIALVGYLFYHTFYKPTCQKKEVLWAPISGMVLGIALSAAYLLPAIGTQNHVYLEREGLKELYTDHYLFAEFLPEPLFRIELTLVVLGMIMLAACALIISDVELQRNRTQERTFWSIIGLLSVLMMTPVSKPFVQVFPVFYRIQFPWRFNTILIVATVALFALAVSSIKRPYTARIIGATGISFLLVAAWGLITLWQGLQEGKVEKTSVNRIVERGTFDINYRPRWVQSDIREYAANASRISINLETGTLEIKRWQPRDIVIEVDSPAPSLLTVGQLYYPGWTARITGEPCCLPLQPSTPDGLLEISIPAGSYNLELKLTRMPFEYIGYLISAFAAAVTLSWAVWLIIGSNKIKLMQKASVKSG